MYTVEKVYLGPLKECPDYRGGANIQFYCGYVEVSKGHPWFDFKGAYGDVQNAYKCSVELTYGHYDESRNVCVYGVDTAHLRDNDARKYATHQLSMLVGDAILCNKEDQ